jgi:hypothetical protein
MKGLNVTESTAISTPDAASIAAIPSPIERARLITQHARRTGNLPPDLAELRRASLIEALEGGSRKVCWVAAKVGLTPSRVSAIAGPVRPPSTPTDGELGCDG